MKKKLPLLAALAVAAVALGVVTVHAAGPGPAYLHVSSFRADLENGNSAKLTVTTGVRIPRQPDSFINANPVVGFAWVDLDTGKVFVAVIHPVLGRDSHQDPESWHAHTASLAGGASAPNDFCVASIDSTPTAGIEIHRDTMNVNVRSDQLPFPTDAVDAAVGFTIQPDAACSSGLAVRTIA